MLPYLVDDIQEEEFSEHNVVSKRQVTYINTGSKTDSIVTVTKSSYQYNNMKLPLKQISNQQYNKPEWKATKQQSYRFF
ncbi:hypothetical protein [Pedobacter sp. NJ-S-72]